MSSAIMMQHSYYLSYEAKSILVVSPNHFKMQCAYRSEYILIMGEATKLQFE